MIRQLLDAYSIRKDIQLLQLIPNFHGLTYVDIGAAGGLRDRWRPYAPWLNYIGFEPNPDRAVELINENNAKFNDYKIVEKAIWNSEAHLELNVTRGSNESSLLEPNSKFVKKYLASDRFDIVDKIGLNCVGLDSCINSHVDFLKIDVQGANKQVIEGAKECLSSILALEIEVEFFEVYKNQFTFSGVQRLLADFGLEMECFTDLINWRRISKDGREGRTVHGDVLFIRSPEDILQQSHEDIGVLCKYIALLSVYRKYDLIEYLVNNSAHDSLMKAWNFKAQIKNNKKRANAISSIAHKFARLIGPGTTSYLSY